MRKVILVSKSPRRRELLEGAGFSLDIRSIETEETVDLSKSPADAIVKIAHEKVEAFLNTSPDIPDEKYFCLGADTEVVFEGRLLGKPYTDEEATLMLEMLSGERHEVITGYAIYSFPEDRWITGAVTTEIIFRELESQEIADYVLSGDPFDKAGGYGIQGDARKFVSHIEGDFNNVVGLPIDEIKKKFDELNG